MIALNREALDDYDRPLAHLERQIGDLSLEGLAADMAFHGYFLHVFNFSEEGL